MHPTLGIDAKFMQTNSCKNIDNIKCIGSKYMDIKMMDPLLNDWCKTLTKKDKIVIYFINAIELFELDDDCLNLIIFVKKYVWP
jgi:hypothetical protein